MKKTLYVLLTAALIASLAVCAALADEVPQPEGGKKFEGRWALRGALMDIVYEEEGYRVHLEMYNPDDLTGQVWEYSCHYNGEKDVLESVSSSKYPYSVIRTPLTRSSEKMNTMILMKRIRRPSSPSPAKAG